ncbi:MAG: PilZ domain-containing protein [Thermodesulfobacteriota bacterium]
MGDENVISSTKKELPLAIGLALSLSPMKQQNIRGQTLVIGAKVKEFILVETPKIGFSERLVIPIEEDFLHCIFTNGGWSYNFISKYVRTLDDERLTLIEYPSRYTASRLRKHDRIPIHLKGQAVFPNHRPVPITVRDLCETGCGLTAAGLLAVTKNMDCQLDFPLPNGRKVTGIPAKIRKIERSDLKRTTTVGVEFVAGHEELEKVIGFCQLYRTFFEAGE